MLAPFALSLPALDKAMTNTIAIWLGLAIIGFFALDHFVLHLDAIEIVLRGILELIDKVAFWR